MNVKKRRTFSVLLIITMVLILCINTIPIGAAEGNMWLSNYYLTINYGKTGRISIKKNSTGKKVTYLSSNVKIATVSDKGVVTGVKAGSTTIIVKAGKVSRKCVVTVKSNWVPVTALEFDDEYVPMDIGEIFYNKLIIYPENASNKIIKYSTSDPSIASVDSNGNIKGIKTGEVIITARTSNGITTICEVDVSVDNYVQPIEMKEPEIMDPALIVKQGSITLGISKNELLSLFGKPGMILDSEFDCPVYIYNDDYSSLVFVYVKDDKVIGYYTNAAEFETCGLTESDTIEQVKETTTSVKALYSKEYSVNMWYGTTRLLESVLVMIPTINPDDFTDVYLQTATEKMIDGMEVMSVEVINGYRGKFGISPVTFDIEVAKVARYHSEDMTKRGYFDHYTPEGISPFDRMSNSGISYITAGEIITMGANLSALENISSFLDSKEHRAIILDTTYQKVGPGTSLGNGENNLLGNVTVLFYK